MEQMSHRASHSPYPLFYVWSGKCFKVILLNTCLDDIRKTSTSDQTNGKSLFTSLLAWHSKLGPHVKQKKNLFLLIFFLPEQSEVKEPRNVFVECLVELVHWS